jgi:hypothetical protein
VRLPPSRHAHPAKPPCPPRPRPHGPAPPDGLAPELAAALPIAYGTADLALRHRGGLRAGQTLLVLGASGGVGTAAVQVRGRRRPQGPRGCFQAAALLEGPGAACIQPSALLLPGPLSRHLGTATKAQAGPARPARPPAARALEPRPAPSRPRPQIGKLLGARVVAVTSGAAKADYLRSLGADAVVDAAAAPAGAPLHKLIKAAAPKGGRVGPGAQGSLLGGGLAAAHFAS